jgi:hypothetical protein
MTSSVVHRILQLNTEPILFMSKEKSIGIINLCNWEEDLSNIENRNRLVVDRTTIKVYFPMFESFYTKTFNSDTGFTLNRLIKCIVYTGLQTGDYLVDHPIIGVPNGSLFIAPYSIISGDSSDIKIRGYNVYVSVNS